MGALRDRRTAIPRLYQQLTWSGGKGHAGTRTLRRLLDAYDPRKAPPQSVIETLMFRLLRKERLPLPEPQHVVVHGDFEAHLDFAYPERLVGIEVQSRKWHLGANRWERDLARHNRLTALGWRILYVSYFQMKHHPKRVAEQVRSLL